MLTDRQTDAGIDRLPLSLQVIGLLDVFTPAAALEDFSELYILRVCCVFLFTIGGGGVSA